MKFLTALLLSLTVSFAHAQLVNCGLTAGTMGATDMAIQPDELSPDPMYTGGPDSLSLNQYLFTYPDSILADSLTSGSKMFFANDDGRILPTDFGMEHGDRFCVQYLHFDLGTLQEQIDVLFADSAFGVPCCDFAELTQGVDVCHIMDSLGIDEGTDIANGNGLIDFATAYGIPTTYEALAFLIDSVLNFVGTGGGPCLASGLPICYSLSAPVCYTIDTTAGVSAIDDFTVKTSLTLSPNPATEQTILNFFGTYNGTAELNVFDLSGKVVQHNKFLLRQGENSIPVNINELPPGIYQLEIVGERLRAATRLIKSR